MGADNFGMKFSAQICRNRRRVGCDRIRVAVRVCDEREKRLQFHGPKPRLDRRQRVRAVEDPQLGLIGRQPLIWLKSASLKQHRSAANDVGVQAPPRLTRIKAVAAALWFGFLQISPASGVLAMVDITSSPEPIRSASPELLRWLGHEIAGALVGENAPNAERVFPKPASAAVPRAVVR